MSFDPCCAVALLPAPLLAVGTGRLAWRQWGAVERSRRESPVLAAHEPRGGTLLAAALLASTACGVATFASAADLFPAAATMLGSRRGSDYPLLGFVTATAVVALATMGIALQRLAIPRPARSESDTAIWVLAAMLAFGGLACYGLLL